MNRYFTKRRPKKEPVQPKFELDLTSALPSQDNFRTSLLMDGLSKRFSMLREQDDPNSLLGKASDDSVLAPRRQSRLGDFGFSPGRMLHDIAEVSSISSQQHIRPPFADSVRANSYISDNGYGTDDGSNDGGSIMNRSRPVEGNNFFSGRQKIYRVPVSGPASDASLNGGGSGLKGRIIYDDDVPLSAFQIYQREEKEKARLAEEKANAANEEDSKNAPYSPSIAGSNTRHTSTSTNSIARTSTAATSITSQIGSIGIAAPISSSNPPTASNTPVLDRSGTKSRRLYDQGLNRDIEEQQSSAMTRLNSLAKPKGRISPPFGRTPSRQGGAIFNPSTSPPQIAPLATHNFSHPAFPLAEKPIVESSREVDAAVQKLQSNPLMSAIRPADRGKATAMGAFNKPSQFSETQYLERQKTLRRGNEPMPSAEVGNKHEEPKGSMEADRSDSASIYAQSSYSGRSRAPTNASTQEPATSAFSVFQNAANQIKTANSHTQPGASQSEHNTTNFSFPRESVGSVYDNNGGGEDHPFRLPPMESIVSNSSPAVQPSAAEHPALRNRRTQDSDIYQPRSPTFYSNGISSYKDEPRYGAPASQPKPEETKPDVTLGLANGGLSGLIRQHLRNGSSASSFYEEEPPPVPDFPSKLVVRTRESSPQRQATGMDIPTPVGNGYGQQTNPFELEDLKQSTQLDRYSPVSPLEEESHEDAKRTSPKDLKARRRRGMSQAPDTMDDIPWQQELKKSHGRGPSTDTIQEQEFLSSEIAKRQRAIQERLRAKMEAEAHSPAVTPPAQESFLSGPFRGLEMLRTKSSRESMKKQAEPPMPVKTTKGFGLGPSSVGSDRPSFQSDRFRSEESSYPSSTRSRSNSRPTTSRSTGPKYGLPSAPDAGRTSDDYPPMRDRKGSNPPPAAMNNAARSRSNSVQSNGRSRSRNGRYKDDLERAMVEGTGSRATQLYQDPPTIPEDYPPPMPSLDGPSHRFGTESPSLKIQTGRSPNGGYFEPKNLYPPNSSLTSLQSPVSATSTTSSPRLPMPGNSMLSPGLSPRPSPGYPPMNPYANAPPPRGSPSPYPGMSTPPMSGASTPVTSKFNANPVPASSNNRARSASRKRSIQKHEIGEPRLISTTSVIDTIALPAGASLRNGMDDLQHPAPPVPPLNPMRRKFGFGRQDEERRDFSGPAAYQSHGAPSFYSSEEGTGFKPRHRLRKSSSEGEKIGMRLRAQSQNTSSNPALARGSARPIMDGGMF